MRRTAVFLLLFAVLTCLNASAGVLGVKAVQDSIGTEEKDGVVYITYLVSPGETIYRISTNHGVSISQLMEINPALEHGLKAGQVIKIPYKQEYIADQKEKQSVAAQEEESTEEPVQEQLTIEQEGSSRNKIHHVQKGETLYSLAKQYGVTVGDLMKWNGMELKAGQKIVVGKKQETGQAKEMDEAPSAKPKEEQAEVIRLKTETKEKKPMTVYEYDSTRKQVMIIPFDPHLYFSDADEDISRASNIPRIKVRDIFRRRLNVLLDPPGYESIHLLGGKSRDTLSDLNKIYSSVSYHYQDILNADENPRNQKAEGDEGEVKDDEGIKGWMKKQKAKLTNSDGTEEDTGPKEKFAGKYFGVKVNDPNFFDYFGRKYSADYYIFINQFEVITDYDHCLDLSTQNYRRYFVAHYSIFDRKGEKVAGNKFRVFYNSNSNNINEIVADNMLKISQKVLNDLPSPDARNY